eukprot:tig00000849_g4754.t1
MELPVVVILDEDGCLERRGLRVDEASREVTVNGNSFNVRAIYSHDDWTNLEVPRLAERASGSGGHAALLVPSIGGSCEWLLGSVAVRASTTSLSPMKSSKRHPAPPPAREPALRKIGVALLAAHPELQLTAVEIHGEEALDLLNDAAPVALEPAARARRSSLTSSSAPPPAFSLSASRCARRYAPAGGPTSRPLASPADLDACLADLLPALSIRYPLPPPPPSPPPPCADRPQRRERSGARPLPVQPVRGGGGRGAGLALVARGGGLPALPLGLGVGVGAGRGEPAGAHAALRGPPSPAAHNTRYGEAPPAPPPPRSPPPPPRPPGGAVSGRRGAGAAALGPRRRPAGPAELGAPGAGQRDHSTPAVRRPGLGSPASGAGAATREQQLLNASLAALRTLLGPPAPAAPRPRRADPAADAGAAEGDARWGAQALTRQLRGPLARGGALLALPLGARPDLPALLCRSRLSAPAPRAAGASPSPSRPETPPLPAPAPPLPAPAPSVASPALAPATPEAEASLPTERGPPPASAEPPPAFGAEGRGRGGLGDEDEVVLRGGGSPRARADSLASPPPRPAAPPSAPSDGEPSALPSPTPVPAARPQPRPRSRPGPGGVMERALKGALRAARAALEAREEEAGRLRAELEAERAARAAATERAARLEALLAEALALQGPSAQPPPQPEGAPASPPALPRPRARPTPTGSRRPRASTPRSRPPPSASSAPSPSTWCAVQGARVAAADLALLPAPRAAARLPEAERLAAAAERAALLRALLPWRPPEGPGPAPPGAPAPPADIL